MLLLGYGTGTCGKSGHAHRNIAKVANMVKLAKCKVGNVGKPNGPLPLNEPSLRAYSLLEWLSNAYRLEAK
jgi:hypothetical protein